jgi:CRISPR-associated protein Cas1
MLSYPDFKEKTIVVIFTTDGQRFSFQNDNLIVTDADEKVVLQTTCYRMLALWIVGHCVITSGLLERSKKFAFPIYLLSINFRCIGVWSTPTDGNFLLREKQYTYQGLDIARHIVKNKIQNQALLIKSIRKKEDDLKNALELMGVYENQIQGFDKLQEILGMEGVSSRLFFSQWYAGMDWKGRKPRAKRDPINVLLDIGYTFLFYLVENMLNLYGFDIYKGVYHQFFYQRKSLVCDIVEPFRCIVDKQIRNAYNLRQIKMDDFVVQKGQFALKYMKSKEYTRWLLQAIIEHKADIFLYTQGYYRAFMRQKQIEEYPVFNITQPVIME